MDGGECALHVEHAIARLPGVDEVHALLSAERAALTFDPPSQARRAWDGGERPTIDR